MSAAFAAFAAIAADAGSGLPWDDPQFWIVTALVAAIGALAVRRVRRALADEAETPCANCPKVHVAAPGSGGSRGRLRVVDVSRGDS